MWWGPWHDVTNVTWQASFCHTPSHSRINVNKVHGFINSVTKRTTLDMLVVTYLCSNASNFRNVMICLLSHICLDKSGPCITRGDIFPALTNCKLVTIICPHHRMPLWGPETPEQWQWWHYPWQCHKYRYSPCVTPAPGKGICHAERDQCLYFLAT